MFKRFVVSLIFVLALAGPVFAQDWPPSHNESLDAGLKILAMSKKGYASLEIVDPSPAILVEPRGWNMFNHVDKVSFARTSAVFLHGYAKEKHKKYMFVFVRDMTSHDVLAVADLANGEIEIKR